MLCIAIQKKLNIVIITCMIISSAITEDMQFVQKKIGNILRICRRIRVSALSYLTASAILTFTETSQYLQVIINYGLYTHTWQEKNHMETNI